jgi:4-hydroxy-3-methylbut-2-enyl diphosphate reductase
MDFGVFVDLGGAEGLVPMRELSWERNAKAEDFVKIGDTVEVLVLSVDPVVERISLSLRALRQNPWDAFTAQYRQGDVLKAKIVRIATFGAFAQLMPGVDGLLSNGRLAALSKTNRIASAHEVVEEGQILEVKIDSIDSDAHKIALRPVVAEAAPAEKPAETEAEKEDDPMEWIRANKVKNANVGNNPFAGLNF